MDPMGLVERGLRSYIFLVSIKSQSIGSERFGAIHAGLDQQILVCPHEYLGNFDFLGGGFK